MQTLFRRTAPLFAAFLAVTLAGCESAVFRLANRGTSAPAQTVVYAPREGLSLDVYRPADGAAGAPMVVFFYGGSWQRGNRAQYRFVGSRLAANGVVAVVADYRTFPRTTFPGFVEDAAAAVAWSHANAARLGADPARLFVAGHSAGAQIAALLATDARYLQRHGLEPRALAGAIGLAGPYDFAITGGYRDIFGPPSQWPDAQAVNFVDGDEPPFLLVHGDADRVVSMQDSVELDARLHSAGVGSTLVRLPGAGHFAPAVGLYAPAREPAVLPAILGFVGAR